jgi:hypothetical protein
MFKYSYLSFFCLNLSIISFMRKFYIVLLYLNLCFVFNSFSQATLTSASNVVTINFSSTVSGVNNGTFDGATGTNATPASGKLDADAWGFSTSGGSNTAVSFTPFTTAFNGVSAGGTTTTGIFSFDVDNTSAVNRALGFQPSASDYTPGFVALKLLNNDASQNITSLTITYNVYYLNNEGRGNNVEFWHDGDNFGTWTNDAAATVTSPDAAAGSWTAVSRSVTVNSLAIAPSGNYYLKWLLNDVSGSGSRDEFAIDDIVITATYAPTCTPPSTQASAINFTSVSNTTATINWTNGNGNNRIVVVKAGSAVAGTPTNGTSYSASAIFGSGATIATNEYVVYNGNGSFVDVTGLSCNTTYHVKVFEYNNTGICYLTTSPPSNSQITLNPSLTQQTLPALNTFTYAQGSGPSASQYREYTATNLAPSTGTVRVTTNQITRYEVSLDNSTFSDFVDISYTGGAFSNVPVYVRLKSGLGIGSSYTANMTATVQSQPSGCTAPVPSYLLNGIVTALPCQELFISEYIEGLAFDKAIEIYNPTANPISLTNYNIKIYSNGNVASSYTANLAGTIPAYGTWVAANVSASAAILAKANQTFPQASFSFDGNDAITLEYNSNILDIFGRIGENPAGGKWVSGLYETAEQTLIRKPIVQLGISANPTSGFPTLGTEWIQYGQSESALLASHFSTCNNTNVILPSTITPTQYCVSANQSSALSVGFITNGTFNTGNVFHAQLSDASGSFSSPILIGSLNLSGTDVSGTINAAIPAGTIASTEYRVRVIATLPNGILGAYISPTKLTVNVAPVNPTVVSATSSGSGNMLVSWANPICFDEMLVIMCTDAPVATIPSGDGSNYNVIGSSECLVNACEQVIYKGTGNSITS